LDLIGLPPTPNEVAAFVEDDDPRAYEQLVDRLLDSPHYGERMTLAWLDNARYADTNGFSIDGGRHMWLWRDWVIHAYNNNLPFDQFVVEQLAGDLLPDATVQQRVATGFNRNHMITHEGGTIPDENLVTYTVDRVKTTAAAFLGLTFGCAQCHDHKYDPITQRDFYRFFAYFNTIDDRGLDGDGGRNATPKIRAHSVLGSAAEAKQIRADLASLSARLQQPLASQSEWEEVARRKLAELGKDLHLHPAEVIKVTSPNRGTAYKVLDDGTVFVPSASGRSPSISARIDVDNVTALRMEFLPDESFPEGRSGHGGGDFKGGFVLTGFSASATALPSDQVDLYKTLRFRTATASFSHPDLPPVDCLDERDFNGWSPFPETDKPQHITFQLERPVHGSETPYITVMLVWGGGPKRQGNLTAGKYRLYAVTGNDDGTNMPADVQEILAVARNDRSGAQGERLRSYYNSVAPELSNLRFQMEDLEQRLQEVTDAFEVMVMNATEKPRETFVLRRGQYDQPAEKVEPGTPDCLPPLADDAPANRLGLAQWLVQPDHPLTARVAVNRLWQMLFGRGIVSTVDDFGSQGAWPTHPELLDWLAVDFVESGWDVKGAIKQIVMSATYRQSSSVTSELFERDPRNTLLARGPRFRLQAELVRDLALSTGGLLSPRIGGSSVHPYQPFGLWKEISHFGSTPATAQVFVQDHGEKLYRRSMYTFWKRTVPPPSMVAFDAPNREVCTMSRSITNTPLQALVLLNDPQFVEASRALAQRILLADLADNEDRMRYAFELVLARRPTVAELTLLQRTYDRELAAFSREPESALAYLNVGESDRDRRIVPAEHAAWTTVASMILNLSEAITRG
jgi:hypothetical protein